MIAAPLASNDDRRSCRVDPVAAGTCVSVLLRAPSIMAGPRQIDHRQQQNQRFATCGSNNYRRACRLRCRPTPRAANKSP
jgi:hypothetical protein